MPFTSAPTRRGGRATAALAVVAVLLTGCEAGDPTPGPTSGPTPSSAADPDAPAMLAGLVLPPSALRSQAERDDLEAAGAILAAVPGIDGVRTLIADTPAFVADMSGVLAREGRDPVCLLGPGSAASLGSLANAHPHTRWCAIEARSSVVDGPGLVVGIRAAEGAYIAGALAARVRQPEQGVGFIGAARTPSVERLRIAYEAGARSVAPDLPVVSRFLTGDTTTPGAGTDDAAAARTAAAELYDLEVATVFTVAADADVGVLEEAQERGRLVIGQGPSFAAGIGDQFAANVLLTVLVRWEVAMAVVAERLAGPDWAGSRTLGLADDAVHIQPGGAAAFTQVADELEALRDRIVAGQEPVPAT